jgi:hypothetical protein
MTRGAAKTVLSERMRPDAVSTVSALPLRIRTIARWTEQTFIGS